MRCSRDDASARAADEQRGELAAGFAAIREFLEQRDVAIDGPLVVTPELARKIVPPHSGRDRQEADEMALLSQKCWTLVEDFQTLDSSAFTMWVISYSVRGSRSPADSHSYNAVIVSFKACCLQMVGEEAEGKAQVEASIARHGRELIGLMAAAHGLNHPNVREMLAQARQGVPEGAKDAELERIVKEFKKFADDEGRLA